MALTNAPISRNPIRQNQQEKENRYFDLSLIQSWTKATWFTLDKTVELNRTALKIKKNVSEEDETPSVLKINRSRYSVKTLTNENINNSILCP